MNFSFDLYPVITEELCNERSSVFVLEEILKAGVKLVQLREKNKSKLELYNLAKQFRALTSEYKANLIINDHLDIALAVQADGIHLGQADLPCAEARKIAPNIIIGVSTHNQEEINKARIDGATYVNVGPIYSTQTKPGMQSVGVNILKELSILLPFTVMGGIKEENIPELIANGAKTVAMITEITKSPDIYGKTKILLSLIREEKSKMR